MAPPYAQRRQLSRDRFSSVFSTLKPQSYNDPPVRSVTSHIHRTISWNASGSLIATGSTDKTVRVWNPERTAPKSQIDLRGHTHGVERVLFNPTREFEVASTGDSTVRFWDTRSKTCTTKLDIGGEGFTLCWSVDGSVLVVGLKNDTLIPISTTSTPTILARHPQHIQTNQTCFSNAHSPPRDLLLTQADGTVKILDYPSFDVLHSFAAHTSSCSAISYNPNGRYVAVGGTDAMLSLWETEDWYCKHTMSSPTSGSVKGLSWSWDGRFLAGASDEDTSSAGGAGVATGFEIYHAETGEVVYTVPTGTNRIPAVEWHPSRYWLAYTEIEQLTGKSGLKIIGAAGGGNV